MKLVTFGIDEKRNLIIQFPLFVQPYTQRRLVVYPIETVPVPILDKNEQAQLYMQLKINKTLYCIKFRDLYHLTNTIT